MKRLEVSENKRFLQTEDGAPFFWLGDTAWELFHTLTREEAELYLNNRSQKGFNVIQAVLLAEHDGIRTPNAYGRLPLCKEEAGSYNLLHPDLSGDYSYWDHVDFILSQAEARELYVALLPAWGDKLPDNPPNAIGAGPALLSPSNAFQYGKFLGKRYGNRDNLIWVMGGDRQIHTAKQREIIDELVRGIKTYDQHSLFTLHPRGPGASREEVGNPDWLDFHMLQTGHGYDRDTYRMMSAEYGKLPVYPVIDGEPRYEDHPISFNAKNPAFSDFDVRQACYWSVFAGGFGITYGNHSVWSMTSSEEKEFRYCCQGLDGYFRYSWEEALEHPAAGQMIWLKNLMLSRPFFERVPAQECLVNELSWDAHLTAVRGEDYLMVYNSRGKAVDVRGGIFSGEETEIQWYSPRNGQYYKGGRRNSKIEQRYQPPFAEEDWVLILDAVK